jgi:hypothetical protein
MSLRQRWDHALLLNNGIMTQYYYSFLYKSTIEEFRKKKLSNHNWKNSWEIKDDIDHYAIDFRGAEYNYNDKKVLLLNTKNYGISYIELSNFDVFLIRQTRCHVSLNDIYIMAIKQYGENLQMKECKQYIIDFFLKLEQYDMVLFFNIMNNYNHD